MTRLVLSSLLLLLNIKAEKLVLLVTLHRLNFTDVYAVDRFMPQRKRNPCILSFNFHVPFAIALAVVFTFLYLIIDFLVRVFCGCLLPPYSCQ